MKEVFWIEGDPKSALAIVLRPRGNDWLKDELLRMQQNGIGTLISMLEEDEADSLGLAEESRIAEQIGLSFLSYPIPDRTTPAKRLRIASALENASESIAAEASVAPASLQHALSFSSVGNQTQRCLPSRKQEAVRSLIPMNNGNGFFNSRLANDVGAP